MSMTDKNIRQSLKEIFSQYSKVSDFLFTTFNFDPDFFEEHIIAYLMGMDRKISTVSELNNANEWIDDNNVSVYYDHNMLCAGNSPLTLPAYPQSIKSGVFHPKVIIIYGNLKKTGKKAAYLFVSSCNLSVSGYGRNAEAFSYIRVDSKSVASSLSDFVKTIRTKDGKRHDSLINYLDNIKKSDNSVEFFWSYGKKTEAYTLADRIAKIEEGDATIVSPYFDDNGPKELIDKCMRHCHNITVMPSIDGKYYNIKQKNYSELQPSVQFSAVNIQANIPRFVHAKIIVKGNTLIVGSYNFTTAALESHNAEAALIIHYDTAPEIPNDKKLFNEASPLPDNMEVNDQDTNVQSLNENVNVNITVTVNWKEHCIITDIYNAPKKPSYVLKINGAKPPIEWSVNQPNSEKYFGDTELKSLIKHKCFSVYQDGKRLMNGLINELDWKEIRPEIGCDSLDEAISEWYNPSDSGKAKTIESHGLRQIYDDDKETEQLLLSSDKKEADVFDNYYLMSLSLENMLKEIEVLVENFSGRQKRTAMFCQLRKKIYSIFKTGAGSMVNILEFLKKSMPAEKKSAEKMPNNMLVYNWIICVYLQEAAGKLPDKIDPDGYSQKGDITCYPQEKVNFDNALTAVINAYEKGLNGRGATMKYIKWMKVELFRGNDDV